MENIQIRELLPREHLPWDLLLDADPSRSMIESYLPDSHLFLASHGSETTGICVLYPHTPETAEIKNIAVSAAWQGKGIGRQLLAHAIEEARRLGFSTLLIGTGNSSIGQLYLYQSQGFEITEIRKDFFTKHYPEPLIENGIPCKHMIVLSMRL